MENTATKQALAAKLRGYLGDQAFAHFEDLGDAVIVFGEYVTLYVHQSIFGDAFMVGVNWSAIGTVGAVKTRDMSERLAGAAALCEEIQHIIDAA